MAPEHRPVATGFFPVARTAIFLGAVFASLTAWAWRSFDTERRRQEAEAHELAPATVAAVVVPVTAPAKDVAVALPLRGPIVAHVWLEGCADCMSAFEAHARIQREGALKDVPQVNVAYGGSTEEFRARYLVNQNLLTDVDGKHVVHPFGIGSFTTLVLDARGALVLRDRPDHAGYVERVREAWARAQR